MPETPEIPPVTNASPTRRVVRWLDLSAAGLVVFSGVFVVVYKALVAARLDRSIAMFVGVPMLIGVFSAATRPKRPVSTTMKYLTICMCLISPMLGEGAVCLAMSAPIVYPIAALIAWLATPSRQNTLRAAAVLPILWAVFVRVPVDQLPTATITDSVTIQATPHEVWRSLEHLELPLERPMPLMLRAGFPSPQRLAGAGLRVGDERRLVFENGTVVARVTESVTDRRAVVALSYERPGHEFFDRWLVLDDSTFVFEPLPGGRTRMTHTTHYRRLLDPEVYFGPLERMGVHLMQGYLLEQFRDRLSARAGSHTAMR